MTINLTKLQVVNLMLNAAGDSPVNSLVGEDVYPEALECERIIDSITHDLQLRGWNFNSDKMTLPINLEGKIPLPESASTVYAVSKEFDVAMRDGYLYDQANNTFVFDQDNLPELHIISIYDFDDLPELAKSYIQIKAIMDYEIMRLGDASRANLRQHELEGKWILLKRMERRKNPIKWDHDNPIDNIPRYSRSIRYGE